MKKIYGYSLYKNKINKHIYYIDDNIDLSKSNHIAIYKKYKGEYVWSGKTFNSKNCYINPDLCKYSTNVSAVYFTEEKDKEVLEFFNKKIKRVIQDYKNKYEKALSDYGNGINTITIVKEE